jgi:hypothetical protein
VALQALVRRLNNKSINSNDESSSPSTGSIFSYHPRRSLSDPTAGADAWTDASVLDSMSILRYILRNMKSRSPLAGVFDDEIELEIASNHQFVRNRPVGLVNFSLTWELSKR